MRNFGLVTCKVIEQPADLGELLDDRSIEVMDVDILDEEVALVSYMKKEDWVEENESSNISLSSSKFSFFKYHF